MTKISKKLDKELKYLTKNNPARTNSMRRMQPTCMARLFFLSRSKTTKKKSKRGVRVIYDHGNTSEREVRFASVRAAASKAAVDSVHENPM